ncbi:MAG: DNA alkylation repair protein [Lachnospiraceae bacterium]|nr:DNA alkylation repair protein [Lachnospiraceae bacterium]
MIDSMREQLESFSEEDYKKFNEKIVPGAANMLGVRLPKLRQLAKMAAKKEPEVYLNSIEEALSMNKDDVYYEEIMIYGFVIGYAKFTDEERRRWLDQFICHIDNWAICDSCCMTYKWMKKNPEYWWDYLLSCIDKNQEYTIRVAVVCMLGHFIDDRYVEQVLEWCNQIQHEGYYVKMAVAWAVSVCFVKYSELTYQFLQENQMDDFTQNKAIQKICDSYRVTKEVKKKVKQLKR